MGRVKYLNNSPASPPSTEAMLASRRATASATPPAIRLQSTSSGAGSPYTSDELRMARLEGR